MLMVQIALAAALAGGWLAPGALAILEEDARVAVAPPDGLAVVDERRIGESQLVFLKRL